ncbi:MAG: DUF6531 domain-containing protein, partial [Angustibacter sp.]
MGVEGVGVLIKSVGVRRARGRYRSWWALVAAVAVLTSLLSAVDVVRPESASAAAAPSSVTLTTDRASFVAGERFTLTATVDVELSGSGFHVVIQDVTSGVVVADCSSGTSCVASSQVFFAGGPRSYRAVVYPVGTSTGPGVVVSADVMVSRAPWSVSLVSDVNTIAAGEQVTLTAKANQDIGATAGSYRVHIKDVTSGEWLKSCQGPDLEPDGSCRVQARFFTGGPRTYEAYVADVTRIDVQATSSTVVVERAGWTVALTADRSVFEAGEQVTLAARANQDVGATGGSYRVLIRDVTTGAWVKVCQGPDLEPDGTCRVQTRFFTGGPHTYEAYVADIAMSDVQATSNRVSAERAAWSVSLVSDVRSIAAGEQVTLTARANQDIGATGGSYRVLIRDVTTGAWVKVCQGPDLEPDGTCRVQTRFFTGGPHTYEAYVADTAMSDVQATSNTVAVERVAWTVALTADRSVFEAGEQVVLTARANQDVGGTGGSYRVLIRDVTTGAWVKVCQGPDLEPDGSCRVQTRFFTGGPHTYEAYVADIAMSDVQATSNQVSAERAAWTVALTSDRSVFKAGEQVTLTARANQNIGATGGSYRVLIRDVTTGAWVKVCQGPDLEPDGTCRVQTRFYAGGPHTYVAYVADTAMSDVQATSNTVSAERAAWSVGVSVDRKVFAAGEKVQVTATPNQDVGLTAASYRVYVKDLTTGAVVGSCGTLTAGACVVDVQFYTGPAHSYAALVANNVQADVQAVSRTVVAQRRPWSVTVSAAGTSAVIAANQDVAKTGGAYRAWLVDVTTGAFLGSCTTMTAANTCTVTVPAAVTSEGHQLLAYIAADQTGFDLQANSEGFVAPTGLGAGQFDAGLGLSNPATNAQNCLCADPVNPARGDFIDETTDLRLPGRFPFEVTRTYSSLLAGREGGSPRVFGAGWSSILDAKVIRPAATGTAVPEPVRVVQENGSTATFTQAYGSDLFTPAPGVNASLTYAGGEYTFTRRSDGLILTFTTSGKLRSVADRNGEGFRFTYPTSTSRVVTLDDGRAVTVTFNSNGRVTTVSGPAGRSVSYTYDAEQNLTAVTDTRGKTWRYVYATPTNHLVTGKRSPVQHAAGTGVVNAYDTSGRISTQTVPFNPTTGQATPTSGTTTFTYSWAGNDPPSTGVYWTRMVDPDGVTTQYTYQSGLLIKRTVGTGTGASSWQYSYDGEGNRTATIDPTGITTTTSYDSWGNQLSTTDGAGNVTAWTYNALNLPTSRTVTDTAGPVTTTFAYDARGNLTRHVVPLTGTQDATTTFTYGDTAHPGDVTTVTDPRGKDTTLTYTAEGFVASETNPAGHKTSWTYTPYGDPLTDTTPRGTCTGTDCGPAADWTTTRTYHPGSSLPATMIDPQGHTTSYGYDDDGRASTVTDARGNVWTGTYWLDGTPRAVRNPQAQVTTTDLTPAGRTTRVTAPDGGITTSTYDSKGQLVTVVSPEGNRPGRTAAEKDARTTTLTYDRAGRPTKSSVPDPATPGAVLEQTTTYDTAGRQWRRTNPAGETSTLGYGPQNRITSVMDPAGKTTDYTHDHAGRLTTVTAPSNGTGRPVTSYGYDLAGNLIREAVKKDTTTDLVTTYTYDSVGRQTETTSPRGTCAGCVAAEYTTTTGYYPDDTVKTVTDPLGRTTRYAYTRNGQVASVTDAKGSVRSFTYDPAGNLATATTPASTGTGTAVTKYTYDTTGRAASVELPSSTTAAPRKHSWTYDGAGRVKTFTNPVGKTKTWNYNLDGHPTSLVTARGGTTGTITYTHDPLGRLTSKVFGDGTPTVSYGYDQAGRRKTMTDAVAGQVAYGYDPRGLIASIKRGTNPAWAYTYRDNGAPATTTRPGTTTPLTVAYDLAGRPVSQGTPAGTLAYGWTDDGQLASTAYPNGTVESQTWDRAGALASVTTRKGTTTLASHVVNSRDPVGNPTSITLTRGNSSETRSYVYDRTDRVRGACYSTPAPVTTPPATPPDPAACTKTGAEQWWDYDIDGNRTAQKDGTGTGTTTTYGYNPAGQPTTKKVGSAAATTYTVDADGNITTDGSTTFAYNLEGRIKTSTTGTTTWAWIHDGDGNLVRQASNASTGTTGYGYDWDTATNHNGSLQTGDIPQLATSTTTTRPTTTTSNTVTNTYTHDPAGRAATLTQNATTHSTIA